jgi:hypothetical protein
MEERDRLWEYDPKSKLMFCDICVGAQVVNSFTSGCSVMKKECVTKQLKPKAESFVIFDDEFGISNCRFSIITHTLHAKSFEKKWVTRI